MIKFVSKIVIWNEQYRNITRKPCHQQTIRFLVYRSFISNIGFSYKALLAQD
jgi:hypothetical protein